MPGLKQPCPTVAACWSPAMPRTRIGAPNNSDTVVPNSPAQSATCGNKDGGTPNIRHKSASHCPLEISNSSVRAARRVAAGGQGRGAAGEAPKKEEIDGPEGEPAGLR